MGRKKPKFRRQEWYKKKKLGRSKNKTPWRASVGIQSKIRLGRAGHSGKPKIGWGNNKKDKNKINGKEFVRIENMKELENLKDMKKAVLIAHVGRKKKNMLINKAKEMKLEILNPVKENKTGDKK